MQVSTCGNGEGFTHRGCKSCWGRAACRFTKNMNIGTNSCHGRGSCRETAESTILNDSCQIQYSCQKMKNSSVGPGSCNEYYACYGSVSTAIGSSSCNAKNVCDKCAEYSIVPDNACNDLDGVDTTNVGSEICPKVKCNYCMVCSMKKKYKYRVGF